MDAKDAVTHVTPITVAHIITKLELGGAQQNTLFTVGHLNPARFQALLITGEPGLLDGDARALPGVEVYQVPALVRDLKPLSDLRALVELTKLMSRLKPTIVHTHSSKAGILGRLAARLAGVPIIIHSIHGFGFTPFQRPALRRLLILAERIVSRFTTRFFAVSEANRQEGIKLRLFAPDQCRVVRSGVDLDAIRQIRVDRNTKKSQLGFEPEQPLVGMVAPLKPQKAPVDFVRVAGQVSQRRPEVGFLLVGGGELRALVEEEIVRQGLTGKVRLLGWRRDIPELMHCLDLFVLTSLWEGLPRVYLEALASGVPVVGTRVDGASEVVRDGENGYLVEPGNIRGLAERILYLLGHPEEAARLGKNGRAIPREFDILEMVRVQEREYEQLLSGIPTPVQASGWSDLGQGAIRTKQQK